MKGAYLVNVSRSIEVCSLCSVIVHVRAVIKRFFFAKWIEPRSINSLSTMIVQVREVLKILLFSEWFELRLSVVCLIVIVRVRVIVRKTVVGRSDCHLTTVNRHPGPLDISCISGLTCVLCCLPLFRNQLAHIHFSVKVTGKEIWKKNVKRPLRTNLESPLNLAEATREI